MEKPENTVTRNPSFFMDQIRWMKSLMKVSFLFFLVKGLFWTALVLYPLLK